MSRNAPCTSRRPDLRRAAAYLVVLGTSMIVTVAGLGAITAARIEQRTHIGVAEAPQARLNAMAAIDYALLLIAEQPDTWRSVLAAGVTERPMHGGSYSLVAIDPVDDDIASGESDPVILRGIGRTARTRVLLEARLDSFGALVPGEWRWHAD
ncbi:MAG: hypothetical protein ACF8QF_11735 [Phycisphaerales bacterium]